MSDKNGKVSLVVDGDEEVEETFDQVKYKENLNRVYTIVATAQNRTGALTMNDCRLLRDSKNAMEKAINEFSEKKLTSFDKDVIDAMAFLTAAANVQQSKAAFTVDGSILLLELLETLENWVNDHQSPKVKLERLRKEREESRRKKT